MEGAREREGLQERSSMGFLFVESSLLLFGVIMISY